MTTNLTARIAWHDNGWNGRICTKPEAAIPLKRLKRRLLPEPDLQQMSYADEPTPTLFIAKVLNWNDKFDLVRTISCATDRRIKEFLALLGLRVWKLKLRTSDEDDLCASLLNSW